MPLNPGDILNSRYRIARVIGQGGFGAVYRAWDMNLEEPVAVKECLDITPSARKQFHLEARLLFRLVHPNLPRVHDHFVISGQGMYLVMDYIEGEDLGTVLAEAGSPLPETQVLEWMVQVCDALEYLHSQNPPIIHRDIKPANIRITPQGKAVLVDFGIAKVYDPYTTTEISAKAVTPGYSSPEQYGGEGTDARSDIYALGATLYHLLTGQKLPESVKLASGTATLKSPRSLNAKINLEIEKIILKCIEIHANQRYQSMRELQLAITRSAFYIQSMSNLRRAAAQQTSEVPAAVRKRRAIWGGVAAGVGVALLLCVAAVSGLISWLNRPDPQPTQAALATITHTALALVSPAPLETTQVPATTEAPAATDTPLPPSPTPTETLIPSPTGLPASYTDEKGVQMALIPAGEFQMGSEDGADDEKPVHTVYLDAFYMDIYEVTNALYEKCVQAGVCTPPGNTSSYKRDSYYGNPEYADYPVIYVSWEQARTFCVEWRGARLPTEAEWEKAARGGLEGRLYPWGNEAPVCQKGAQNGANFSSCTSDDTEVVGSYAANGYGLFDMAGNVWERVWDWYGAYSSSSSSNPQGPGSGEYRVLRGGGWARYPYSLRVADRDDYYPVNRIYDVGFRCGVSAPPGP